MEFIAHRGLSNKYIKENTIDAFKNAINNGYKGIELDIRKTKDNKIVVIHDKYINRTSNGVGNINKFKYKELLKYNFGSDKIKSKIPLLEYIIKKFNNIIIFIELKESFKKEELERILKMNKTNNYYIMSSNKEYIKEFINSEYKIGIVNNIFNSYIDIKLYNFILILDILINNDIYNYLIKNNIEPVIYNINNRKKNIDINRNIKYIT